MLAIIVRIGFGRATAGRALPSQRSVLGIIVQHMLRGNGCLPTGKVNIQICQALTVVHPAIDVWLTQPQEHDPALQQWVWMYGIQGLHRRCRSGSVSNPCCTCSQLLRYVRKESSWPWQGILTASAAFRAVKQVFCMSSLYHSMSDDHKGSRCYRAQP